MNHPIPVTITHDGKPLDLSEYEVRCLTCEEVIEPVDVLRGRLIPHKHEGDGDGCSPISLAQGGRIEKMMVRVEGLDEAGMNADHPTGLRKVVADELRKLSDGEAEVSVTWLKDAAMQIAEAAVLWEREGCAQECEERAKSQKEWLARADEAHDCYATTHVAMTTAEDLAESIRDRDGSEDLADTAERLSGAEVEVRALREVLQDYPGRSIAETEHNNWCFVRDRALASEWRARLTLGDHFERVVTAIEGLRERNAMHKRGFRLGEQPQVKMLTHALEEVSEIIGAHALGDRWQCGEEVGDAIACLLHYSIATSINLSAVFERWLKKIPTIFPEMGEPKDRIDLTNIDPDQKFKAVAHVSEGCCVGNADGAPCLCKCHSAKPEGDHGDSA